MSLVTIHYKLLPAKVADITVDWVTDNWHKLVVLPRLSNYRKLDKESPENVQKLLDDVTQLHEVIRNILRDEFEKNLAAENRKKENNYANPITGKPYTDAQNITKACLKTKQGEGPADYIQRVVPFLLVPTKNKNNRSHWVQPAVDRISSAYCFEIGRDSAGKRNHFIDEIAQNLLSDFYAQKFNRALKLYHNAKFYYSQTPEGSMKVQVEGQTFCYTIIKDAKEQVAKTNTDAKNDFIRSTQSMASAGFSEEAVIGLVRSEYKSQVGIIFHSFLLFLLSILFKLLLLFCMLFISRPPTQGPILPQTAPSITPRMLQHSRPQHSHLHIQG